jgi:transcriptional regulator with AAA-type ATPase domain
VRQALAENNNNQGKAAEALKLGYHQFRRLLKKYAPSPD